MLNKPIISTQIWYFILAADITEEYSLSSKELPMFNGNINTGMIYQSLIGDGTVTYISHFDASNALKVPVCGKKGFSDLDHSSSLDGQEQLGHTRGDLQIYKNVWTKNWWHNGIY